MVLESQTLSETVGEVDSTTSGTVVQIVEASFDSIARARTVNAAIRYAGGSEEGWIQPSSGRLVEDPEGKADSGAMNAFNASHNSASFDVDIDSGEGAVGGAYILKDTPTTVTLDASTNNQDVYVGWADGQEDTLIIGKSGDFTSDDPKTLIWTFDTDSNGVTSSTDQRNLDDFRVRNEDVQATQNFTSDETFSGHPIGNSDIGTDAVDTDEIATDAVDSDEIVADAVGSSEADTANIDADEWSGANGTADQGLTTDGTNTSWTTLSSILSDGGGDELDLADLAGGDGTANQTAITDGSAVTWQTISTLLQDGGGDEMDAADFTGSSGSSGQFLQTDGSAASWGNLPILFGDGSDGAITRSSNGNENGVIMATDYTINAGTTMTVSNGKLVVVAQNSITINGTIDASGQGSSGGAGGNTSGDNTDGFNGGNGSSGAAAWFNPEGSGGSGGSGDSLGGSGGSGGNGDQEAYDTLDILRMLPIEAYRQLHEKGFEAGSGGGGGAAAGNDSNRARGDAAASGSPPGGGGGANTGDTDANPGSGGTGGNGGGLVILIAPEINGSGSIDCSGDNGQAGGTASSGGAHNGGGGGGTGGVIAYYGVDVDRSGIGENTSGGTGGTSSNLGGDGADGAAGNVHEITP